MKEKGSNYEGRDEHYLDIDRMINEGLAGGNVYSYENHTNIEEAREIIPESPPNNN